MSKQEKKRNNIKQPSKKMKLNRETVKDLDTGSAQVKGGARLTGKDTCYVRTCP